MNFSTLPDPVFLKIFGYLPFNDRIRVGRVDKTFRRMSLVAISDTKSLRLDDDIFAKLTPETFDVVLELCHGKIKTIDLGWRRRLDLRFFETTVQYSYPRLIEFSGDMITINEYGPILFDLLLAKNSNLKIVKCPDIRNPIFSNIVHQKLENLKIGYGNNETLTSMIGRIPNLKSLTFSAADTISVQIFDMFLENFRNLNSLEIWSPSFDIKTSTQIWNMAALTELILKNPHSSFFDDVFVRRIAVSMPRLRLLNLKRVNLTEDGFRNLGKLEDVRNLDLECEPGRLVGVYHLAGCGQLEKLTLECGVLQVSDFRELARHCAELRRLSVGFLDGVDGHTAVDALQSLAGGIGKRNLVVEMSPPMNDIWRSDGMKMILRQLKEIDDVDIRFLG